LRRESREKQLEEGISTLAGEADMGCPQGNPLSPFGVVVVVDRVVHPPGAVVVPEMVVRIVRGNPDTDLSSTKGGRCRRRGFHCGVVLTAPGKHRAQKKPPINQDGGLRAPGELKRSTVLKPLHIDPSLDQTTVGISTPGWQRAV
jgi:hypothetical protein